MTTAAIYLRQSLDVQEGIERQRSRCASLASARGWDVVGEYADNDTSASKSRGAGTAWARLIEDAKAGRVDVVIAVDLDRLLRTISDLLLITETGAKVLTVDGEIDLTTADGEFRATMLAGIARFEARRKGERQKRATAQAASKGRRTGGRRPFGFDADGRTVRPAEAAAIRSGYSDFLAGASLAEIARTWNAAGLFSGSARYKEGHKGEPSPWRHDSVRTVLANPRNMGKRAHLGEIVADAEWPAIVDESTWRATEAALNNPARRSGASAGRYLLSGTALCGVCGSTVHAGGNARRGVPSYRCSGSMGHFARKAAPVEEFVEAVMVARLSKPDARDLLTVTNQPDTDGLRDEANGLRERLDALAVNFADGSLTASQLRVATERIRSRLEAVEGQLADAGRVDLLGPMVDSADVASAWASASVSRRRSVIALLAEVTIYPPGRGVRTFNPDTVAVAWLH